MRKRTCTRERQHLEVDVAGAPLDGHPQQLSDDCVRFLDLTLFDVAILGAGRIRVLDDEIDRIGGGRRRCGVAI